MKNIPAHPTEGYRKNFRDTSESFFIQCFSFFFGLSKKWYFYRTDFHVKAKMTEDNENSMTLVEPPDISCKDLARSVHLRHPMQESCKARHFLQDPCKNLASNIWSLQESCKKCLNVLAMHITRATNGIIYAIHWEHCCTAWGKTLDENLYT